MSLLMACRPAAASTVSAGPAEAADAADVAKSGNAAATTSSVSAMRTVRSEELIDRVMSAPTEEVSRSVRPRQMPSQSSGQGDRFDEVARVQCVPTGVPADDEELIAQGDAGRAAGARLQDRRE